MPGAQFVVLINNREPFWHWLRSLALSTPKLETFQSSKSRAAFAADALATMFGSVFGLSPVTSYIESASGVEAGSRTGLTAVICGFYFFMSIFFAPIIASIPPWATGGALIIVGALMCRSLGDIKWCESYNVMSASECFVICILFLTPHSHTVPHHTGTTSLMR